MGASRTVFASRAFCHAAPAVWNRLPCELTDDLSSLNIFRRNLKTHLYRKAFRRWPPWPIRNSIRQLSDRNRLRQQLCNNNNNDNNKWIATTPLSGSQSAINDRFFRFLSGAHLWRQIAMSRSRDLNVIATDSCSLRQDASLCTIWCKLHNPSSSYSYGSRRDRQSNRQSNRQLH